MNITDISILIAGTILGAVVTLLLERLRNPSLEIKLGEPMDLEQKQARWLRLKVVNRSSPIFLGLYRNPAFACRGLIKFFDIEKNSWAFETPMEIRWTSSRELTLYDQSTLVNQNNQVLGYLLDPYQIRLGQTMDIWSDTPQNFDVVFRYFGEDECYGWSNENYKVQDWRIQERKLSKGVYIVEVSIASATLQQCKGFFRLINEADNSFKLEVASSEEKEKIIEANRRSHDPENWRRTE